jgi:hypothetical protein
MRFVVALILFAHGFAHLVGFVVPWRMATLPQMPYKTTVLANSLDVGKTGIRVVGIVWLLVAVWFWICTNMHRRCSITPVMVAAGHCLGDGRFARAMRG